jgi:hypothetical protein
VPIEASSNNNNRIIEIAIAIAIQPCHSKFPGQPTLPKTFLFPADRHMTPSIIDAYSPQDNACTPPSTLDAPLAPSNQSSSHPHSTTSASRQPSIPHFLNCPPTLPPSHPATPLSSPSFQLPYPSFFSYYATTTLIHSSCVCVYCVLIGDKTETWDYPNALSRFPLGQWALRNRGVLGSLGPGA